MVVINRFATHDGREVGLGADRHLKIRHLERSKKTSQLLGDFGWKMQSVARRFLQRRDVVVGVADYGDWIANAMLMAPNARWL